jgi:hypothetical protein
VTNVHAEQREETTTVSEGTPRPIARKRLLRSARRAVKAGETPIFRVDLARREVAGLPGLVFDGARPPEIAEAARRTIAAEIGVRPERIEVEPVEYDEDTASNEGRPG